MHKILIAVLDDGPGVSVHMARAKELESSLAVPATPFDIEIVRAAPGVGLAFLERHPDVIVAVGYSPADLLFLAQLACPVLWDMRGILETDAARWLAHESSRRDFGAAVASAQGFIDVPEPVALRIEDELKVGITSHALPAAIAAAAKRIVVIIGAGLGNMIYAGPMLRWLSERMKAPLDLVIHNRFDDAVSLFARAPWLNAVYPGFEYLIGRHYHLAVSAVTAGVLRPPFTADRILWVDQERDYNIEGRFIHETRLNFLGLEQHFEEDPSLLVEVPAPFIRDIAYHHAGDRIIGVASGKKTAAWANREWHHMEELVARLSNDGWEVRSFGLPDESVSGAEDLTGLPMRKVLQEIAKCSFFISHDGGLCHMAEAIGVPTIWLFGPTSSIKNGPFYLHSRVLSSRRACGPCIYKVDWLRCDQPLCMQDITVDEVVQTLESLHAELQKNGYTPSRAREDTELLRYEVEALLRPGPKPQQENNLRERTSLVSYSAATMEKLALKLLQKGDLAGSATMVDSLRIHYPDSRLARTLSAVITHAFPAPTMARDLGGEPPANLECNEFPSLIEAAATLELSVCERRSLFRAVARYLLQKNDKTILAGFLRAAIDCKPFIAGQLDSVREFAAILGSAELESCSPEWVVEFESYSPPHRRMAAILSTPVSDQLERYSTRLSRSLACTPKEVRESAFTPHLARAQAQIVPDAIPLQLGEYQLALHHHSVVMAIVPHVMVKNAVPGSTSNLLVLHMTRLAMLGLRPVVVSVGFDDIPDGWAMRDSVTYIQGHRFWNASNWARIAETYTADVVFAYAGVENDLDLPSDMRSSLVHVTLDGLFDPKGIYAGFSPSECWTPDLMPAERETGATSISADALSEALFVVPDRPPIAATAPLSAVVMLNDARDFTALVALVTAIPSVKFTVLTALRHRGIEKNLHTVSPKEVSPETWETARLLIQFSTQRAALAAESIVWLERSRRLIAATRCNPESDVAGHFHQITDPQSIADWVKAVQRTAGEFARERMVLWSA